jgi:hypothetical protein
MFLTLLLVALLLASAVSLVVARAFSSPIDRILRRIIADDISVPFDNAFARLPSPSTRAWRPSPCPPLPGRGQRRGGRRADRAGPGRTRPARSSPRYLPATACCRAASRWPRCIPATSSACGPGSSATAAPTCWANHAGPARLGIQLKGAGQTPYSRFADGRAVLRSSIREFLCSEAMAALGIPTTRALCVVGSSAGAPRNHRNRRRRHPAGAQLHPLRLLRALAGPAPDGRELRQLADYVIERFRPECRDAANPYEALLRDVGRRTGELIATGRPWASCTA